MMKLLGYLFLLAILLAVVGYARGWFIVDAPPGKARADLRVTVDRDRLAGDTRAVLDRLGTQRPAAEPVVGQGSAMEGRIAAVASATRELTLEGSSRDHTVHTVAANVPITRGGATMAFGELQPDMHARLSFDATRPLPVLVAVAILP